MYQEKLNPWQLEVDATDIPTTEGIDAENINPEIPRDLWDSLLWKAIRAAIDVSDSKEEVLRKLKEWNSRNNPSLSEKDFILKALWALDRWETKFSNH